MRISNRLDGGGGPLPDFSIAAFRRGSLDEFKRVYEHFYDVMYWYAFKLINREEEAKDIATDMFVKLWKDHQSFDTLSKIKAFLYTATRNASIDFLRHGKVRRRAEGEIFYLTKEEEGIAKNAIIEAEIFHELSRQIENLPPTFPNGFKLIFYDNLN